MLAKVAYAQFNLMALKRHVSISYCTIPKYSDKVSHHWHATMADGEESGKVLGLNILP